MEEKANYPNKKNKKNKIDHFLAFRRKAKNGSHVKQILKKNKFGISWSPAGPDQYDILLPDEMRDSFWVR